MVSVRKAIGRNLPGVVSKYNLIDINGDRILLTPWGTAGEDGSISHISDRRP